MAGVPAHVEIMDPVDRWLHLAVAVGVTGALVSGPFLESPALTRRVGAEAANIGAFHGGCAFVALMAWAFHLVRVCLSWLEGRNPLGLLPRPGDLAGLMRGIAWNLGIVSERPRYGRFSYRERVPYGMFLVALPLLILTGWAVAHPGQAVRVGPRVLLIAASVHSATGLLVVPFLLWHLFFALLQPKALYWNGSWLTGRAPWARVEGMRPDWAREIAEEITPESLPEIEEAPSVEVLLERGNREAVGGRFPEAERAYEEALHLYPGYSQALFNLGVVRSRAGNVSGAIQALEEFLKQDPFSQMAPKAREVLQELRGEQAE